MRERAGRWVLRGDTGRGALEPGSDRAGGAAADASPADARAPLSVLAERAELAVGRAQHRALRWALERTAGMTRAIATLGDLEVPYLSRGRGRPLLLVHGFGGNKETWLMTCVALSRGRRLIVPDLPGHGEATPVAGARATAGGQARTLLALLDALGIERADIVGTSMGGGIALRLARDAPDRVATLGLIASVGPVVEKSEVALALERGENPLIPTSADDVGALLELVTERPPRVPRSLSRYVTAERIAQSALLEALFDGWQSAGRADAVPEDLDCIATPALVIHGARDRVIHPATGRALHQRLRRAELVVLDGIGHLPQLEVPRLTASLLDGFLARQRRA